MGVRPILPLLALGALGLSACASADYGYGYCYGPGGPVGYYYGPLEPKPSCARQAAGAVYYGGPYEAAGRRGEYYSGPYSDAPPPASPAAAR
jgi:hypothetical protein